MLHTINIKPIYYAEEDTSVSCRTSDLFIDKEIRECVEIYVDKLGYKECNNG